jgi:hypothetical protein
LITNTDAIRVFGADLFGVIETIETSYEPFFPKLTNNRENIKKFLRKIKRKGQRDGINLERGNELRKFSELTKDELIDLNKSLFKHLMQNTGYQEDRVNYFSKKIKISSEKIYPILSNTWDYARAIKDALNKKHDIMALSVLLGNRGEQYERLVRLFASQRSVLNSLFTFFKPEDIEELKNLRYFAPGEKVDWYNAANVSVMLLSSGMTTIDLPLAVIVPGPEDMHTIAIRMSSNLETKEDLTNIILAVLDSNDIGQMILGDKYSAQIRVANGQVDEVLQLINEALGDQDEV